MTKWLFACFLSVLATACDRQPKAEVLSASESTSFPCFMKSPWLALRAAPSAEAAIGVLEHVLGDSPAKSYRFKVQTLGGEVYEQTQHELLSSPEGEFLPTLGPLHLPAVFDVNSEVALVWGKRGWGCVSRKWKDKDFFRPLDPMLDDAIKEVESQVVERTNSDAYTLHHKVLITLREQPLRDGPSPAASIKALSIPREYPCKKVESLTLGADQRRPPALTELSQAAASPGSCTPAVRILKRVGEWVLVGLPRADHPIFDFGSEIAISWDGNPAGWARVQMPGPVNGSRLIQWHVARWGPWP